MGYSFNLDKTPFVFAQKAEINASYKDLSAVCDFIRYKKASEALETIDKVISMETPIPFRRHNKRMGARHELGGRKGAYPVKAAKEVREVLINAISNADNEGKSGMDMYIIHAAANKTRIESRYPSKGSLAWGRGMYGRAALMHSDLEYAKVEIGLGEGTEKELTKNMKYFIKKNEQEASKDKRKEANEQKSKEENAKEKAKEKVKA